MTYELVNDLATKLQTVPVALSRKHKRLVLILIDLILFVISIYSAFGFRLGFESLPSISWNSWWLVSVLILIKISIFIGMGIYRRVLRYTGTEFILMAIKAVLLSSSALVVLAYFIQSKQLPRSVLLNDALLTLLFVVGVRLGMRSIVYNLNFLTSSSKSQERIIIYGAGATGSQIAHTLAQNPDYRLIAFVDDNRNLHHHIVQGLTVYSPELLPKLVEHKDCSTILLAMPSIDGRRKKQILNCLQSLYVQVKTVPSITEILSGNISISKIRNVDIADILGREQVAPQQELLQIDVTDKTVLVTGAGGSIGSELCRQIAKQKPKCLILFELNEFALYSIEMELSETYPTLNKVACLGSVNDSDCLTGILKKYRVNTVYHAAAYKHVPLVEANPSPGILNNVLGTLTLARCASESGVSKFVLISTDKAVRPTNVMGATKRVAELILQAMAQQGKTASCFTMVRFGNVLGSSGSVVPRFRQQIAEGKAITVTHPQMTRYFMSIPEAASLVIQAGAMAKGGEVFLLDMGEPVRIYDLALSMIQLSGLELGKDVEIEFSGLRPGEKIYEELLIDTANAQPTKHPKIFSAKEPITKWEVLKPRLDALFFHAQCHNYGSMLSELKNIVPEYQPQKQLGSEGEKVVHVN